MTKKSKSPEYLEGVAAYKLFKETGVNNGNPYKCLTTEWYEFSRGFMLNQKYNLKK